ncbi:MAG: branched-chain alpha-keto acid dehydrogenase subunit E2 [Novosphingobium sp. SCN 66-18]|nr:MAG: branched-chain alpha-keto acid dehydrogenase subunit E2 [Novosphingobium sp. SCN 66-18]
MGKFIFRLPDIGEGIAEAEIVAWHVKIGDRIEEDGRVADMMTDKATVEMESPVSGVVIEVAGDVGDVVAIGSPLVVIETEGEDDAEAGAEQKPSHPSGGRGLGEADAGPAPSTAAEPEAQQPPLPNPLPLKGEREKTAPPTPTPAQPEPVEGRAPTPAPQAKVLASPAVRQRAKELGIDLAQVRPSEEGRIRHADLDQFLAYNAAGGYRPASVARGDEVIKVIGLRRRIAENMAASKRNIPHFSYVEECDVTALEAMRAQLNSARGDKPKLTMLPLLIAAICRTLPRFPMLNARYDDEAGVVTRHGAVHLGMATQTPAGLMVPVIRDAQDRNLWQLAAEIVRLAEAARNGTAKSEELSGSTLTVTSLGPLGGVATTPVINRPEVAIIGPNRIVERPMFVPDGMGGERIEKRKLMNISISCDHRVVDGWDAASFVQEVKKLIETPVLLLAD